MLSKSEKAILYELGKVNLEGVVLRNDFVKWLCILQNENVINGNATTIECMEVLEPLELKIAKDENRFKALKKYYTSKCEMPQIKPKRKIGSKPTKEEIIELHINKDLSQRDTAKILRVSIGKLFYLMSEYGIKKEKKHDFKINKPDLEALCKKHSVADISKITGISIPTIYNYIKTYNIKVKNKSITSTDISNLRKQGKTVEEVTKILDISRKTYYKKLNAEVM